MAITRITKRQRSSCVIKIFRFNNPEITDVLPIQATNDKGVSGAPRPASDNIVARNTLIIKDDVIRCNITKNKSSPTGNFSLTLKKGTKVQQGQAQKELIDYLESIHPGDWIMIYMKKNGEIAESDLNSTKPESGFKFLGVIENVRYIEQDNAGDGKPRLEYVITGSCFGKVFDTNVFFNPLLNQQAIQAILGADFLTDAGKKLKPIAGNTPDAVTKGLVNFFMGGKLASRTYANDNLYIPGTLAQQFKTNTSNKTGGKGVIDILSLSKIGMHNVSDGKFISANPLPGAALIKALPTSGTIWSILQFYQNSAINEMFTELSLQSDGSLKPSLVMRQVPFSNWPAHETSVYWQTNGTAEDGLQDSDKTYFTDLPRHVIKSTDIKQKNIGKSDFERINYVIVTPKIDQSEINVLYVASANVPSIQRYGLRLFQTQTSYVLDKTAGTVDKFCQRCVNLLQDWFFLSHNLFNGTIITDGFDKHIEVGNNLYIEDVGQLFHIEGYTHTYEVLQTGEVSYDTELRVSRGQRFENNVASFLGKSESNKDPTTIVVGYVPSPNRRKS